MNKIRALGVGGVLIAAVLVLAVSTTPGQSVTTRALDEKAKINLSGSPRGPYGSWRVELKQNARVDSYNSDEDAYDEDNPGSNVQVGSSCDPNDINAGVSILNNAEVYGDIVVTEEGKITVNKSTVTGELIDDAQPWTLKPIVMPAQYTLATDTRITKQAGNYTISGNAFTTSNNANVTFVPGVYRFDKFQLNNGATFNVGAGDGMVEIYVGSGGLVFDNNSELLSPIEFTGDTTRLRFYYNGTAKVDLSNNVEFYGFIYAPNAMIEVRNNDKIYGNLVGKEVYIWNNAGVHYDEALSAMDFGNILGPPAGYGVPKRINWEEKVKTE